MVNSLTANMEIGGPMTSLYLLENPDHYTNYKFRAFYWKLYVNINWNTYKRSSDLSEPLDNQDDDIEEDNILLLKMKSEYVGYSPTLDYIHRPDEYSAVCLYDQIILFDKAKIYKRKSVKDNDELDEYNINENEDNDSDKVTDNNKNKNNDDIKDNTNDNSTDDNASEDSTDELDILSNDNKDESTTVEIKYKKKRKNKHYKFLSEHPQSSTYTVKIKSEDKGLIPNFVSPVPRSDSGDREYYCASMMTLFKPWRNAEDLKSKENTWDNAFYTHIFSDR